MLVFVECQWYHRVAVVRAKSAPMYFEAGVISSLRLPAHCCLVLYDGMLLCAWYSMTSCVHMHRLVVWYQKCEVLDGVAWLCLIERGGV
jgi:uncharacterized protein YodC (DUF2158 family)